MAVPAAPRSGLRHHRGLRRLRRDLRSTAATAATMGAIAMPEMRKRGYNDALSTGSLAVGGTLGILIPPSTPMIIYAIIAECSIGKLFSAASCPVCSLPVCILSSS